MNIFPIQERDLMWMRILLCSLLVLATGVSQELKLVKTIPAWVLKSTSGAIPKLGADRVVFQREGVDEEIRNEFGFFWKGERLLFYTGAHGWVLDVETGELSQMVPANLENVRVSLNGEWVIGMRNNQKEFWSMHRGNARSEMAKKWCAAFRFGWMHPTDGVYFAPDWDTRYPYPPYGFHGVLVVDLATGRTLKRIPIQVSESEDHVMSRDGKWVFGGGSSIDPLQVQNAKTGQRVYFDLPGGPGDTFLFNQDASLAAGTKLEYDGFTFIWARKTKQFIWKSTDIALPSAFSPNNTYLLCEGAIVRSISGEVAYKDLKGISGKFSPNGRSLVTVDDEAFYIYTLPKDSEPIFGVFQAPEPWSPPKPVKRTAPFTKKPLKKP